MKQRILLRLLWAAAIVRRVLRIGTPTKVHTTKLKGVLACEACGTAEATVVVPSGERIGGVYFCDFCYRRWKRANQTMAIPRSRKPKKGGGGGRAA